MSRFTFSKIFGPWMDAQTPPTRPGWYRTRTEALTHSWWNGLAYFDGKEWQVFGQHGSMPVRRIERVLQWQGLAMPAAQAIELVRNNMPTTRRARLGYEKSLRVYFGDGALA